MELININELKKKAKIRYILHLVFVSLLLVGVVTGLILSLLLSTLDYQINMIINIVVSVVVAILTIFYFTNIFPIISHYYIFYKNLNEVGLDHRRRRVFVKEEEPKNIQSVKYRVLLFSYKEGETEYKESLYILDNNTEFTSGKAYKLATYRNVIVKCEDLDHAND